jgi:hypothetical protein
MRKPKVPAKIVRMPVPIAAYHDRHRIGVEWPVLDRRVAGSGQYRGVGVLAGFDLGELCYGAALSRSESRSPGRKFMPYKFSILFLIAAFIASSGLVLTADHAAAQTIKRTHRTSVGVPDIHGGMAAQPGGGSTPTSRTSVGVPDFGNSATTSRGGGGGTQPGGGGRRQ